MFKRARKSALAVTTVLSMATGAIADDLFTITATPDGGTAITESASSVIDLVKDVIDSNDKFASLEDADFSSSLTYAGLKNAITFEKTGTPGSRTVTVSIPSTGFSKTFTDEPGNDVEDQIEDFLKKDGSKEVAKFIQKMNQQTFAGVTDGNPVASTSIMARHAFTRFGMRPTPFRLEGEPYTKSSDGGYEFRIDAHGGALDTDAGDGFFGNVALDSNWRFNDTVSLSIDMPITYAEFEGARAYQAALVVGVPIRILPGRGNNSLRWMLTPSGLAAAAGSLDMVSGGVMWGVQLTSSLSYTIAQTTFTLANQYGYYSGFPITYGDFEFDTDVEQQILKNGVQIQQGFGNAFIDAGIAYTNLLEDAAVDNYWSPTVGIGIRFGGGNASGFRIGYAGEFGDGFTLHGGEATLFFSF